MGIKRFHKAYGHGMTKERISQCPSLYSGVLKKTKHFFQRNKAKIEKYAINGDRFDEIVQEIIETKPTPFEIYVNDETNIVIKCCIRMPYDDFRDICIVFGKNAIVTFYINGSGDNHFTLDTSKYDWE